MEWQKSCSYFLSILPCISDSHFWKNGTENFIQMHTQSTAFMSGFKYRIFYNEEKTREMYVLRRFGRINNEWKMKSFCWCINDVHIQMWFLYYSGNSIQKTFYEFSKKMMPENNNRRIVETSVPVTAIRSPSVYPTIFFALFTKFTDIPKDPILSRLLTNNFHWK